MLPCPQSKVEEMQEQFDGLKESLDKEEANSADLTKELEEKSEKINTLEGERDTDLGELTDELRADLDKQQEDLEEMQRELDAKEEEMTQEKENTRQAEDDLKRAQRDSDKARKDGESNKMDIDRLKAKVSDMRKDNAKIKNENAKIKKDSQDKNKSTSRYIDEITELTQRDKELQDARDEAVLELNTAVTELEELSQENDELKNQVTAMMKAQREIEADKQAYEDKIQVRVVPEAGERHAVAEPLPAWCYVAGSGG